jgi:agmatine deiminase
MKSRSVGRAVGQVAFHLTTALGCAGLLVAAAHAKRPDLKTAPQVPKQAMFRDGPTAPPEPFTPPPSGPVTALAEWEDSDGVLLAWPNASVASAYAARGPVYLIADSEGDRDWWQEWLAKEKIANAQSFQTFVIPSDSIWVRDYGPWPVLDSNGTYSFVDVTYFPEWRPKDDAFVRRLGDLLGVPVYQLGIAIEGGNFYLNSSSSAFSSTSVHHQNKGRTPEEIAQRMREVMGIFGKYHRFKIGGSEETVQHIDMYLKPLSPDTFVVADFPEGSRYRDEANAVAETLAGMRSGYGTATRVIRMPMVAKGNGTNASEEHYRGYINSFISNRAIFVPMYGGPEDDRAKEIYSQAMPGYEVVGVDAASTWWTDAVHCRSRNLIRRDTMFVKTTLWYPPAAGEEISVSATVFASPGAVVKGVPVIHWRAGDGAWQSNEMERMGPRLYHHGVPGQPAGTRVQYYIEARDTRGFVKTAPIAAPVGVVEFTVK